MIPTQGIFNVKTEEKQRIAGHDATKGSNSVVHIFVVCMLLLKTNYRQD